MKYLDNQPLVGINPDVKEYEGVLLPFSVNDLYKVIIVVSTLLGEDVIKVLIIPLSAKYCQINISKCIKI